MVLPHPERSAKRAVEGRTPLAFVLCLGPWSSIPPRSTCPSSRRARCGWWAPGRASPALLTVLALHALEAADVVVYDALVDARILALARPGAALDYAGKRGGKPSPQQPDITLRLIRLAREGQARAAPQGRRPVRVRPRRRGGGWRWRPRQFPSASCRASPPGSAGSPTAGIPATHRDTNSAVAFVTGQASGGACPTASTGTRCRAARRCW